MDQIDIEIIKQLKQNSRINASSLSEKVNMSTSAVIGRIKKLESTGIIKQYTVVLDNRAIKKDVTAFISISLEHPKFNNSFSEATQKHDDIVECHYITGDFDYILKVITKSTETLEKLLNEIKSIKGVSKTYTITVLSTIKNNYTVLPEAE